MPPGLAASCARACPRASPSRRAARGRVCRSCSPRTTPSCSRRWHWQDAASCGCPSRSSPSLKENGWGGRDRTYECRNQNPVPYHLATPQRKPGYRNSTARTPRADAVRACVRDGPSMCGGSPRERAARVVLGRESREHAGARPGHARLRRRACERDERLRDFRKSRDRDALQVVAAITLGKDVYFRRRGRACQFGRREDVGGPHVHARKREREPMHGQRDRRQPSRRCRARSRSARRRRTARPRPASRRSRPAASAAARAARGGSAPAARSRRRSCRPRARRPAGCASPPRCRRRAACRSRPSTRARRAARDPRPAARRGRRSCGRSRRRRAIESASVSARSTSANSDSSV